MKIKKVLYSLLFLCSVIQSYAQDTIKLKPYIENMKTVDVFIEGKKYNFLFDTGGAETIISPEIAKIINKEIYGSTTGFRMSGEIIKAQKADSISFLIGKTKIFHQTVGVWNLMSILPKEFTKIDGVLSLKSFAQNIITIEISKNILIIENNVSAKKSIKGKSLLTTRFANGIEGSELNIFVGIPKINRIYWFLFDSGNSGPLLLSNESSEIWKIKKETQTDNFEKNPEAEFIIGKKNLKIKPFARDIIYDGVLNFDAISKYVFTIDFKNKEVWFE
ncbi:aspartyl protease family protein [Flavobacterium sp. I-SCBP12n]|uniref:Aspartyl protease family protein n=1 Tax=Flavobacterium pygoscelis TaxID=2893176 RepID=A0A9X2BMZ7_9FLAO|nr:aspartyl protease family protein [Flavobacterium pygoscelis]MCK8143393.1 aspartyl protease family protein [Flavobacterium pygoscelis]